MNARRLFESLDKAHDINIRGDAGSFGMTFSRSPLIQEAPYPASSRGGVLSVNESSEFNMSAQIEKVIVVSVYYSYNR